MNIRQTITTILSRSAFFLLGCTYAGVIIGAKEPILRLAGF